MPATVFASAGGRKYHFDKDCKAFEGAQTLSDLDCGCDTYCTHRLPVMHGLIRMSSTKAALDGKLPCLGCVPKHLRDLPETQHFGHQATEFFGVMVCARCTTWDRNYWLDEWGNDHRSERYPVPVAWPCTSAIVLGLAPRSCPHCKGNRADDPDDPGDWIREVGMHNPYSAGPCPECNGTGHAAVQQP